jgi:hypothetical protein
MLLIFFLKRINPLSPGFLQAQNPIPSGIERVKLSK